VIILKNNYIVRLSCGKLICFYRDTKKNLCYRAYKSFWQSEKILYEEIQKNYTVTITENDDIYIFFQDANGNILLLTKKASQEDFSQRIVLKNQSDTVKNVLFKPFLSKNQMSILYNIPSENKTHKLVLQPMSENGTWQQSKEVDTFLEYKNSLYDIQEMSNSQYISFYKNRENNIGFREITKERWGDFNSIYPSNPNILDTVFLTTTHGIHCLAIVKTMFSSQLIYKAQTNNGLTSPKIICETPNIETPLISIAKNNIYITFVANNQLYMSVSEDGGLTFKNIEQFKQKFCKEPTRAIYISNKKMDEKNFFIRDVYVDSLKPWDIQFMPDLVSDFFFVPTPQKKEPQPVIQEKEQTKEESQNFSKISELLNERIKKLEAEKNSIKSVEQAYLKRIKALELELAKKVEIPKQAPSFDNICASHMIYSNLLTKDTTEEIEEITKEETLNHGEASSFEEESVEIENSD